MFARVARCSLILLLALAVPVAASAQDDDDDAVPGRLLDEQGRQIGTAAVLTTYLDYGLYFKLWLDNGTKLRILTPKEDARRSAPAECTVREYRIDPKDPTDDAKWKEIGSGTAIVDVPSGGDEVRRITGSMKMTTQIVGDNEVPVSEPARRFTIVLR